MNASPAMETGGPLMCLGATVDASLGGAERTVAVADLFAGPGSTVAAPDELLVAVDIPAPPRGTGSAYVRLEYRRQMEIAVVGATAVVTVEGGTRARGDRRDHGARPDDPARPGGRGGARGSAGDDAAVAAAARPQPRPPPRSPTSAPRSGYRRAMAEVIARRAIGAALVRARGGTWRSRPAAARMKVAQR